MLIVLQSVVRELRRDAEEVQKEIQAQGQGARS